MVEGVFNQKAYLDRHKPSNRASLTRSAADVLNAGEINADIIKHVIKELGADLQPGERLHVASYFPGLKLIGSLKDYPLNRLDLRGADLTQAFIDDDLLSRSKKIVVDHRTQFPDNGRLSNTVKGMVFARAAALLEQEVAEHAGQDAPDVAQVDAQSHVPTASAKSKKPV